MNAVYVVYPQGSWQRRDLGGGTLIINRAKSVGGGVRERIIDFGPGYRVYFGRVGDDWVILLGGGTKKRQQKDIDTAKILWTHYKAQRRQGK